MAWKFTLRFTGDEKPLLTQTQFWATGVAADRAPSSVTVNAEEFNADLPDQQVLSWTAGVRALAALILRAYAHGNPKEYKMQGGRRSPAQSLAEAVSEKHAKGGTSKTWAQKVFTPTADPRPINLVPAFFVVRLNYDIDSFSVKLGRNWQEVQLEVFQNGHRVSRENFVKLAEKIWPTDQHEANIPKEKLAAELLLSVCDPRTQQVVLLRDSELPLRAGSGIIVHVTMNRPAHVCVVWFNSRGEPQPLYPWADFNWASSYASDKTQHLALPEAHTDARPSFYPIGVRSGIETAILLARDEPLPPNLGSTLSGLLRAAAAGYSKLRMFDPHAPIEFCSSRSGGSVAPRMRLEPPQLIQDPFSRFKNDLLDKLSCRFELVMGVAFTVAARLSSTR